VSLREAMVTYAGEVANDGLLPEAGAASKAADVVDWTNGLIADRAEGSSSKQLRPNATKLPRGPFNRSKGFVLQILGQWASGRSANAREAGGVTIRNRDDVFDIAPRKLSAP
jgi:hypothetical protein